MSVLLLGVVVGGGGGGGPVVGSGKSPGRYSPGGWAKDSHTHTQWADGELGESVGRG